jgi:EAL domain-containing protein (putative c-di-GMP-specific phosphodiesterase class I)
MDRQKVIPELSINLSGTSVTDNDFLDYVLEQISEYGVGTSKLCFEITEPGHRQPAARRGLRAHAEEPRLQVSPSTTSARAWPVTST